jgi:cytochrome P450
VLGTRPIAPADLPNLPYTLAVLEEAMRLLPPVPITARMATEQTNIGGYEVNKGELAMISIYNIHRHPQFWPDAKMFKPERFLPENKGALHRNAYLPFLSGGHMCIGNHFALMEGQLLLAMMAQQFDVREVAGQVIEKHVAVTMRPKNGLMVQLTPR